VASAVVELQSSASIDHCVAVFNMPDLNADYSAAGSHGLQPQISGKAGSKSAAGNGPEADITSDIDIIDIRCNATEMDLKLEIMSMLKPAKGPKQMPTLLLYDERGLQIFEKVWMFRTIPCSLVLIIADNVLGRVLFDEC